MSEFRAAIPPQAPGVDAKTLLSNDLLVSLTLNYHNVRFLGLVGTASAKIEFISPSTRRGEVTPTYLQMTTKLKNLISPQHKAQQKLRDYLIGAAMSPTVTPPHGRKSKTLNMISGENTAYRWKLPHSTFWLNLSKDKRLLLSNDNHLTTATRLLLFFFPHNTFLKPNCDIERSQQINVIVDGAPFVLCQAVLDYLIGDMTQPNEDGSAPQISTLDHATKRYEVYEGIESLRVLSCTCLDLRKRIEGFELLWYRIYWEFVRVRFPTEVMNSRKYQWSPKAIVSRYITINPTCRCGTKTSFIDIFNLKYYCKVCFNEDQRLGLLNVSTNFSQDRTQRHQMSLSVISPYSGCMVECADTSSLFPSASQVTNVNAVQPVQRLELVSKPGGEPICSFKFNKKNHQLERVELFYREKGFELLDIDQINVKSQRAALANGKAALLVALSKLQSSTNQTNVDTKKRDQRSLFDRLLRLDSILNAGTTVSIVKGGKRKKKKGTVVTLLEESAPGEFYSIDVGTPSYIVAARVDIFVSETDNNGHKKKKRKKTKNKKKKRNKIKKS